MSEKTVVIRGGHIIDASQGLDLIGDVRIVDGRISEIGDRVEVAESDGRNVFDASGCVVSAGFVDLHCHLRDPGQEDRETIASGTLAAARGGFTTVCCMANTEPPVDSRAVVEYILRAARENGVVRVLPIACVTKGLAGRELTEMSELVEAGAIAFSDDGKPVQSSRIMRSALDYSKMFGRPIVSHAEDVDAVGGGVMNEGPVATRLGLKGWPNVAEEIMVARDVRLAELTGGRLHVAHVSTRESVEIVRRARTAGLAVTAEVTPHHLTLTDEWVAGARWDGRRDHPYNTSTKVNPPLRSEEDRLAVIAALRDGTIDAIVTDHAPYSIVDKLCEYDVASFGISGFETALAALLRLVHQGVLTLPLLLEKMTVGPSRVFGLSGGTLRIGSAADVTIFDPCEEWVVDSSHFASLGRNTPLDGLSMRGRVVATLVDGEFVYLRDRKGSTT